jgi:hypothetical protein
MRNSKQFFKIGVIVFIIGVALYFVMQTDYMKQSTDRMANVSTSMDVEEDVVEGEDSGSTIPNPDINGGEVVEDEGQDD